MIDAADRDQLARTRRAVLLAGVVGGVGLVGVAHLALYWQPFDDSFISYRYAQNLSRGLGFVFNPGERVEGYSSFLWTVLLAAADALRLPVPQISQVLSAALGLGLLLLTWQLHSVSREPADALGSFALFGPLWLSVSGTWAYYAATGMETTLFASLLLGAVCCLCGAREVSAQRALAAGLLLAAAALTRPEGPGYALACVVALAVSRAERALALRVLAGFALLFVPYFAWRYQYFGFLAPNTYYAKASPSAALRLQGLAYVEACLLGRGLIVPLLVLLFETARRSHARPLRLCAALCLAALASSFWVGGDAFFFYRFLLPAMPCAYVGLALLLERKLAAASRTRSVQLEAAGVALGVALVLLISELVPVSTISRTRSDSDLARARGNAKITADYFEVGAFLREHVRPGSLVALNAVGIVPYLSQLPSIDMLGLTDLHIAHTPIELGHGVLGHEKHDAAYVLARKPALIILGLPQLAPSSYGPQDLPRWLDSTLRFLPGDRALLEAADFQQSYRPARFALRRGALFAFVRRDVGKDLISTR